MKVQCMNINDTCRDGAYQAVPQRFVVEMIKEDGY